MVDLKHSSKHMQREEHKSLPFYNKLFYNAEEQAYLMALTLNKKLLDTEERISLIESIETLVDNFAQQIHVDVHYSGLPYIRTKSTEKQRLSLRCLFF